MSTQARSPHTVGRAGGTERRANMWWVGWRLQRMQVAVVLALAAIGVVALAILRWRIVATFDEMGCALFPVDQTGQGCLDATGAPVWQDYGLSSWSTLAHLAMLLSPIAVGAFAAAPLFTREFSRGTHVLALTQSVARRRWFAVKATIMVVPLVVVFLALGVAMQWTDGVVGVTAENGLESNNFFTRGIMPAAIALAVYALTLAAGMVTRSLLPALVAGILIGFAMLYGLNAVQLNILPADRTVTPMAQTYPVPVTQAMIDAENARVGETYPVVPSDKNQAYTGNGYLNAAGGTVHLSNNTVGACYNGSDAAGRAAAKAAGQSADSNGNFDMNTPAYRTAVNESTRTCFENAGVVAQYTDILPGSLLWPLRWVMTGVCVLLAAFFLGVAAWRLPRAVAKR